MNDHANSRERPAELERSPSKLAAHDRADGAAAVGGYPVEPFFELSLDLCAIAGYDGYYKQINSAFERVLGYTEEESLSRPFIEFIHPDDRQQAADAMQDLLAGKPVVHFQDRNICKDGSYRWLEWTVTPVKDRQLVYGIGRDITERKEMEETLRQREQRFDLAVRGSTDGLWDWTAADGDHVWWSPRVYELLGYQDGEIRATHSDCIELLHPEDRDRVLAEMDSVLQEDMPYDIEHRLRTKSGDYRWFRSRGVTVRDEEGQPIRMAGSIQDIHDRKRAEEQLAGHRDHLEETVAARARELIEADVALKAAHRRLLKVGEYERKRLANELHDSIGQMLLAIKIGVDLAASNLERSDGHQQEVQALRNVTEQCAETIREIRNISYDLYPPTLENMGLPAALRQLGRSFEPAICYQLHFEATLAEARFDSEQEIALFRIAQEAVSNALRHGKATRVSIFLERQGPTLKMTVRDDGVGFDTATKVRVGWGLRSMTERAQAIGGTSAVTSRPGETTVEVSVPVQLPEAEKD